MNRYLGLATSLIATVASAYPISPQTLWELSGSAEVIVIAKVERLHADVVSPTSFTDAAQWKTDDFEGQELVRLRVLSTLKGSPGQELDVQTAAGMICPAPGRFLEGKIVLAFLSSNEGRWYVEGLSYGTLYPEPDELPVFKERIAEAVKLQAGKFTPAEKLDWAVRTAARKATRWQGAYELASGRDRIHAFYDRKRAPEGAKLDDVQRKVLADGFVAEPSADGTTAMIADLLNGFPDARVDRALVGAVDTLLEGVEGRTAYEALSAVIARAGGDPTLLQGLDPRAFRYDMGELRKAWALAKKDLKLPAGVKVNPTKRVPGVGEGTRE